MIQVEVDNAAVDPALVIARRRFAYFKSWLTQPEPPPLQARRSRAGTGRPFQWRVPYNCRRGQVRWTVAGAWAKWRRAFESGMT